MKNLFVFALAMFLPLLQFYSCNSKEEYIHTLVKGVVTDIYTGDSIPYCEIYLLEDPKGGTTRADEFETVLQQLTSDDLGEFFFEFDWKVGYSYGIIAKNNNYFDYNSVTLVKPGDQNTFNLSNFPKSWLAFHLKNIDPYNEYDTIRFSTFHNFYVGINVDTILFYEHRSDVIFPYRWWVIKNQVRSEHYINPFCTPLDTCFFEIYY